MSLVVGTNISAQLAQDALRTTQRQNATAMERLSTGLRINSAKDDAAGLAISQKLTSQIRGLNQAVRNINDGISLLQTADGALSSVTDMLQRIRELAVQSANGTYTDMDREYIHMEAVALQEEIRSVIGTTSWNGKKLLDGSFIEQKIQSGAEVDSKINLSISTIFPLSIVATASVAPGGVMGGSWSTDPNNLSLLSFNTRSVQGLVVGALVSSNQIANSNIQAGTIPAGTTVTSISNGSGGFQNGIFLGPLVPTRITLSNPMAQSFSGEGLTFYTNREGAKVLTVNSLNNISVGQVITGEGVSSGTVITSIDYSPGLNGLAGAVVLSKALTSDATGIYNFSENLIYRNIYSSQSGADSSIAVIDNSINSVNLNRAYIGSYINRLVYATDNATNMATNLIKSRSSILDADYALETTSLAKNQIIQQAATAMLVQANQQPQLVLKLLENL